MSIMGETEEIIHLSASITDETNSYLMFEPFTISTEKIDSTGALLEIEDSNGMEK
jgi:hypothetical protein